MTARHMGNMNVTKESAASFPPISEFYGHLTIEAGAHLVAPNLQKVRGWVTIHGDGGMLTAEHLGAIDGWLTVVGGHIRAPNLLTVVRDVALDNADIAIGLLSVGSLTVAGTEQGRADLDCLRSISGNLTLGRNADMDGPQLEHIGGSITLKESSTLRVPNLKHIGGFYDADPSATLVAPAFLAS